MEDTFKCKETIVVKKKKSQKIKYREIIAPGLIVF